MRLLDCRPLARIVSRRPDGGGQPCNGRLRLRTNAVPIENRDKAAPTPSHVGRVPIEMTDYRRSRVPKEALADPRRGSIDPRGRKAVEINGTIVCLGPQVAPGWIVPVSQGGDG